MSIDVMNDNDVVFIETLKIKTQNQILFVCKVFLKFRIKETFPLIRNSDVHEGKINGMFHGFVSPFSHRN